jgi:hypothetical protein
LFIGCKCLVFILDRPLCTANLRIVQEGGVLGNFSRPVILVRDVISARKGSSKESVTGGIEICQSQSKHFGSGFSLEFPEFPDSRVTAFLIITKSPLSAKSSANHVPTRPNLQETKGNPLLQTNMGNVQ